MKLFIATLVAFVSVGAFAFPTGYNTSEIYLIKTELDTEEAALAAYKVVVGSSLVVDTAEGQNSVKRIKVNYDSSVDAATSSTASALSISIPNNAIITNVSAHIVAAVSSPLEGTPILGLTCDSAYDLWPASDFVSETTNSITSPSVVVNDDPSTWIVSDGCTPSVSIGVGTIASSISIADINFFIDYMQSE